MRNWILGLVMLGLLAPVAQRSALAQQYVPEAQKKKARALQIKAIKAYRTKKFQAAVQAFLEAYEAWPRRELHFNISLSYGRLGDKINAVTYLRRFVKDASARELASIPKWLKDIDEEVAVVNIQGPAGAQVSMDGKEVGTVPLELVLMPGMHLFVVTLEGRRIAKRDWDVTPGLRKVWEVVEAKERPRDMDRPREVPRQVVIVQPPPPPKEKPLHLAVTVTTGALALILAGAATGTGLKAQSLHDDYKANPTAQTRKDGIFMRNTTNGLWGAAGAVALTAGIMAIFTRWTKAKEHSAALPWLQLGVDAGGASVSVSGQF